MALKVWARLLCAKERRNSKKKFKARPVFSSSLCRLGGAFLYPASFCFKLFMAIS